jgi:hypothetical protein
MTRTAAIGLALAVMSVSTCPGQPATRPSVTVDHTIFDEILKENVRDERVDYLNVRRQRWKELRGYLDRLAGIDVSLLPRGEQLAYYINLYNATMIDAVIRRLKVGYSPAEHDFGVFDAALVRMKGRATSLNDLEHKIIRPTFGDPRVHAALVCAARSCPPLLGRAYRAGDLNTVLQKNMRRFVNDPKRNRIDAARRQLGLSRIFDWYADDFGGRHALTNYLSRYTDDDVSGFELRFLEYSWELNLAPPRDGKWVAIAVDKAALRSVPGGGSIVGSAARGEVFSMLAGQDGWIRVERPFDRGDAWLERQSVQPIGLDRP